MPAKIRVSGTLRGENFPKLFIDLVLTTNTIDVSARSRRQEKLPLSFWVASLFGNSYYSSSWLNVNKAICIYSWPCCIQLCITTSTSKTKEVIVKQFADRFSCPFIKRISMWKYVWWGFLKVVWGCVFATSKVESFCTSFINECQLTLWSTVECWDQNAFFFHVLLHAKRERNVIGD